MDRTCPTWQVALSWGYGLASGTETALMKRLLLWVALLLATSVHATTAGLATSRPVELKPQHQQARAALLATQILTQYHYKAVPLDDSMSARIFDNYLKPETIAMFEATGVMTKKELEARNEVKWETYTKKIQIEARVLGDLAMNHIIPVATQYQTDLINNVYKMQSLFPAEKAAKLSAKNLELIEEIADRTAFIKEHVDAMIEARKVANKIESEREKAIAYHDTIVPALEEIRYHIDKLELIVDNQMWTLPKYRELLFVR